MTIVEIQMKLPEPKRPLAGALLKLLEFIDIDQFLCAIGSHFALAGRMRVKDRLLAKVFPIRLLSKYGEGVRHS